ncbi:MAG: 16S rRNA (adenine(1518)-N(6)/adenine(1519)-N(6))-dimethyltransferase RsmA [Actinomycetota bacterium]
MDDAALIGARRIRGLLDANQVRLTKSLGQNFVIDPNTIRKMVSAAEVSPDDHVLEIGAGAGSLTLGLAAAARRVTAIEMDKRLAPILDATLSGATNVEVVYGDALVVSLSDYRADTVVANLPYNIAATVVIKILEGCPTVRSMTVMTQKEVAERLAAEPDSKTYGQTSVLVAFDAGARTKGSVSRNAFFPVPNVDSSIVRLDRHPPPEVDRLVFKDVVKAAFAQRRKTVRNSLATLGGGIDVEAALREAEVDPGARAEVLTVDDFVRVARVIAGTDH